MAHDGAFDINRVTREIIFNNHLNNWHGTNKAIRRALGFREIGSNRLPKFASRHVQALYNEIDKLAIERLPVRDIGELHHSWHEGTGLQDEINDLVNTYGKMIWGEPMDKRDLDSNPASHLLVAEKGDIYATDLFIELENHRHYIALQLEHLAYIKAIAYHRNHYKDNTSNSDARARSTKTPKSSAKGASGRRSLIVRLPYRGKHLHNISSALGKRNRNNDDDSEHEPYEEVDEASEPRRVREGRAKRASARGARLTCEHDLVHMDDETLRGPTNLDHIRATQTGEIDRRRSRFTDSTLSDPPEGLLDDDQEDPDSVESGNEEPAHSNIHEEQLGNEHQDPLQEQRRPGPQPQLESELSDIDRDQSGRELGAAGPLIEPSNEYTPEAPSEWHDELRILVQAEFKDIGRKQVDADYMWQDTQEVNQLFKWIWEMDKKRNREQLGHDLYQEVDKAVNIWITHREAARTLGVVIGLHPLQQGPIPRFSYEQWVDMLGGENAFQELELRLTQHRMRYLKSGANPSRTLDLVSMALASASRHPFGAAYFKRHLADYNTKLFSWQLDFAS